MSEDDRQRRHAWVKNTLKISMVSLLITGLAFMFVRPYLQIMVEHNLPTNLVDRKVDYGEVNGSGRFPMEVIADDPFNVSAKVSDSELQEQQVWTTLPDGTRVISLKNRSSIGHQQETSWPQNINITRYNDSTTEVRRSISSRKLIKNIRNSTDHASRNETFINEENNKNIKSVIPPVTGVYRMKIRPNQRQINYYDDFTVQQTDTPTAVKDASAGNYNAFELNFNKDDNDSKENENPDDGSDWLPIFRPDQELAGGPSTTGNSGLNWNSSSKLPPVRSGMKYSADQDRVQSYASNGGMMSPWEQFTKFMSPSYWMGSTENQSIPDNRQASKILQPPSMNTRQLPITPSVQHSMPSFHQQIIASIQPTINEINWRRIGVMAVIKLGLIKLKTIGFLNILLFLLLKIKMFISVVLFKFLSLLKILKLFKFLIIPLMIIPFFPILASLIYPKNQMNPQVVPTSSSNLVNYNIRPVNLLEDSGETEFNSGETVIVPGSTTTITRPQIISNGIERPDSIFDTFNFLDGQRFESSALLDPNLDIFQNELDSEKCVERIACKMATTGRTGIMPLWINWMLHGMTKSIPNDKFVYYLKAYDDVTNEIHTKSPNPDSWEKWCFERYECDNNNETDETDTR